MRSISLQKKIVFSLIIFLFPIFVLFSLELLSHFYFFAKYGVPGKSYGIWRYDQKLGATHKENSYNSMGQMNNFGFRNKEDVLVPQPKSSLRIIAYGGSTTFCYNIKGAQAWPLQLQGILRKNFPQNHDQVFNGGAVAWSFGHVLARMKQQIPILKPDYVLLYVGINEELNDSFLKAAGSSIQQHVENGEYGVFAKNLTQNNWFKRNSFMIKGFDKYIYGNIKKFLDKQANVTPNWPTQVDPYIYKNYTHILKQTITLLKKHKVTPVFIIQIHKKNSAKGAYLTAYSEQGIKIAAQNGAIIVDPREKLDSYPGDSNELFATCCHVSPKGANFLATVIFEKLKTHIENTRKQVHNKLK